MSDEIKPSDATTRLMNDLDYVTTMEALASHRVHEALVDYLKRIASLLPAPEVTPPLAIAPPVFGGDAIEDCRLSL